ncbi:MAG: hypothetical protein C0594_04235 [Marinilabiliales bacterium]|nr:MAG: hypothetical protein C0594_04235 [Marinilabiliales bacterium]
MKRPSGILGLLLLLLVFLTYCEKPDSYPINPQIEYEAVYLIDTTDPLGNTGSAPLLVFSFVDGDGDIGLKQSDTSGVYSTDSTFHNNLFFTLYEKVNGEFQEADSLLFGFNYRIPFVGWEESNRALKGQIYVQFVPLYFDTIKFEFYMVDRALHKSNVETSPEIALN